MGRVLYCNVVSCRVVQCSVLYCIGFYCVVFYCVVWCCIVLDFTHELPRDPAMVTREKVKFREKQVLKAAETLRVSAGETKIDLGTERVISHVLY